MSQPVLRLHPPYEVWAAVILVTRQVSFKDVPATAPLSGYDALFAPIRTEERLSARVVAAGLTQAECEAALAEWKAQHPDIQGDTVISSVRLGRPSVQADGEAPASASAHCIGCGVVISGGFRCQPCTKAHWEAVRAADPGDFVEA
jgi:hypothetical protein